MSFTQRPKQSMPSALWFPCGFNLHPSPPTTHNTERSTWRGEVARGVNHLIDSCPLLLVWMWDVALVTSWEAAGGDAQSELGLIVLFVCSLYVFLPGPLRKKPQALWPLNPQRWGPRGDKGRAEGRSRCNMWSPCLGRAKQFFFNWPCNLPQLGWITGENSSLEKEWGDWHTADQDEGDEEKKSQK